MKSIIGMLKDGGIFLVITIIAGLLLGGIYQITQNSIILAEEKTVKEANRQVFHQALDFKPIETNQAVSSSTGWREEGFDSVQIDQVWQSLDEKGNQLGYVLQVTSHEGYGGDITFVMGIGTDGTLYGISILQIGETAGLGMKANDLLVPQFAEKKVERFDLTKSEAVTGSQIDVISGATITSNAFVTAANAGLYYFRIELGGGGNES